MSNSDEITAKLKDASSGLVMPSESDYPFEPFLWSDTKESLTAEKILELTNHPENSPVETIDLPYLFRNLAQEQEWHDEQQKENVGKYRKLLEVLESNLSDIQVFRVGEINIDVYVVGKIESGDLAGLATKVVET
ncbi:MAG: nuclease A inhibitor family protein [Tolypothrix sp. T3-bin4]|nr:nuclease A inhibitor family protein [Tolypothrix sp. Co-bin9]MBD0301291.1 nuclease A inhibitor family protein [Tolypothrix sp. T3-bin4]